jgi:hypothetical protein
MSASGCFVPRLPGRFPEGVVLRACDLLSRNIGSVFSPPKSLQQRRDTCVVGNSLVKVYRKFGKRKISTFGVLTRMNFTVCGTQESPWLRDDWLHP